MTQPIATIVIPCYNGAAVVGEAIDSALQQSYSPVEVVVVDDGSTDDSLDVLKSFGDRIRWESGPNRGGCAARNRGIRLASGEIIQFLDADDLLHRDKLEKTVPRLLARQADVVFCDIQVVDAHDGRSVRHYTPRHDDTFSRCCFDDITTPGPLHWKKNLSAVGGFDEGLPCSQERDLHLRLACHGYQFEHLPETLVTVRRYPGSVSSDYRRVLEVRRGIVERCVQLLEERDELTESRRRCLAGMLANDARALLRLQEPVDADAAFRAARRLHPDGGLDTAYSRPTRFMVKLLGPACAEAVIQWKRRRFSGRGGTTGARRPAGETSHTDSADASHSEVFGQA